MTSTEPSLVDFLDRSAASLRSDPTSIAVLARLLDMDVAVVTGALQSAHGKRQVRNLFGAQLGQLAVPSGEPDFEPEQDEDDTPRPYNPESIRVDSKPFSLKQVMDEIAAGDIDLAPDFQRDQVWKDRQKVRLIESILLRIPLPAFYFSADTNGRLAVVDGVQRLSTIRDFVGGKFALTNKHLEYLKVEGLVLPETLDLERCFFADLSLQMRRRLHQTQIAANVIDPQTPDQVKFDIFIRINTGGSPLNAQEIRHSLMRERSRTLIKRLCENEAFLYAVPGRIQQHARMVDREVVLRFLAFSLLGDPGSYPMDASMDAFLLDAIRKLDDPTKVNDARLLWLELEFHNAMRCAALLFGDRAFRKWPSTSDRQFPFNKALFESWGFALRAVDFDKVTEVVRDRFVAEVRQLMDQAEYVNAISVGTGGAATVRLRFGAATNLVARHFA